MIENVTPASFQYQFSYQGNKLPQQRIEKGDTISIHEIDPQQEIKMALIVEGIFQKYQLISFSHPANTFAF